MGEIEVNLNEENSKIETNAWLEILRVNLASFKESMESRGMGFVSFNVLLQEDKDTAKEKTEI